MGGALRMDQPGDERRQKLRIYGVVIGGASKTGLILS
jgi:hypothetical protein